MTSHREAIVGTFSARGLRCTPQRYVLFDYLRRHPSHLTADEIFRTVNSRDPRASRATVYNSLHALVKAGLVREVALVGHATHYECHTEDHHHFVCGRCGRIDDVEWFDIPDVIQRAKLSPKNIRSWELVLHGLCKSCAAQKKERNARG